MPDPLTTIRDFAALDVQATCNAVREIKGIDVDWRHRQRDYDIRCAIANMRRIVRDIDAARSPTGEAK